MIVDTSALLAILTKEPGWENLRAALVDEPGLPAPAMLEYMRVAAGERLGLADKAFALLEELKAIGMDIVEFTGQHGELAVQAIAVHGKALESGGKLNLLDLMVYAVAKERAEPLLCTGKDFVATDLELHAASRPF